MELENKVAVVTGAGSGIGRAIAIAFAAAGAKVVVTDVNEASGADCAREIESRGGLAAFERLDTGSEEQQKVVLARVLERFGALHVACNSAGISVGRSKTYRPLAEVSTLDWLDIIQVNLHGVFFGMRGQIPAIVASGGGSIVNIASVMGLVAREGLAAYAASKHGVLGLTKVAALDYAGQGVRVNAIAPGYIDTPILAAKLPETLQRLAADHPMGRLGRADEIAELAVWLASDRASFCTGACYQADGGYAAR